MSYYEFFCPVKIIAGQAALEHLPYEISARGASRPLLITDKGVRAARLPDPVIAACEESSLPMAAIYDEVPPDSSTDVVRDIARLYRAQNCDALIAIGGGSSIDTAKAVNILVSEGGDDIARFSGAGALTRPLKPFFVIPTTAGTGSEVTSVAVIADRARGVKLPFTSPFLLPDVAIIDPRMTLTLPPHITAATAMDALTHAVEAYTGLARNPLSDAWATAAVRKISGSLIAVMDEPDNPVHRLNLAEASTMTGIAFSNSMVGLVHALGHATGALCHLPHGLCMSLYLPYALEYNLEKIREPLGELLLYLEGPQAWSATPASLRAEATLSSLRRLRDELWQRCQLPRTLRETGQVSEDQLEQIARLALDDGAIMFNPRGADHDAVLAILRRAWG